MSRRFLGLGLAAMLGLAGFAQSGSKPFPVAVFTAKKIAVVNDTRTPGVEKGAAEALAAWGQFKVVDDPQLADITLRFEKERTHDGRSTQGTNTDGTTSSGYSMSFAASVHMEAFYKEEDTPFYSTKTEDGKAKAGTSCVNSFHSAYRAAAVAQGTKP